MTLTPLKPKVRKLRLKHVAPKPVVRLRLKQPCKPPVTKLRLKQKAPARVFHEVVLEDGFACYRSTEYADALAIYRKWVGRGNKAHLHEIPYFERDERGRRIP